MAVQEESIPTRAPTEVESTGPKPAPGSRILLVEDDPAARLILKKRLLKNGFNVREADDGSEALTLAKEFMPDIIISDWMMPVMDGCQLCEAIKADPVFKTSYFILLTARDGKDDKIEALDTGADEYLVKPCDPHELMARIRAAERVVSLQRTLDEKNNELHQAMDRINNELQVTGQIQRSLLPQEILSVPGYEFSTYYQPSTECSGDYYDIFELSEGRFGILILDVSGHGTPAMVAMSLARCLFHLHAHEAASAADLLCTVNRLLFHHLPTTQFMTAFYCVCDPETGEIQYSSAGHNPPLLINPRKNSARYLENCEGFPLKLVSSDANYSNQQLEIAPGETLLLYTDGIPEGNNENLDMFDNERLAQACLEGDDTPDGIVNSVIENLRAFTEPVPWNDDVTMILLKRRN